MTRLEEVENYTGVIHFDEGVEESLNSADFAEWIRVRAEALTDKMKANPYFETQQRVFLPETEQEKKKRLSIEMEEGA